MIWARAVRPGYVLRGSGRHPGDRPDSIPPSILMRCRGGAGQGSRSGARRRFKTQVPACGDGGRSGQEGARDLGSRCEGRAPPCLGLALGLARAAADAPARARVRVHGGSGCTRCGPLDRSGVHS